MAENSMKKSQKLNTDIERKTHTFDASEESFGRLCSKIAILLRGKNKVNFAPNLDMGDYVIVVNSDNLKYTGNKGKGKIYYRHSWYLGGLKSITLEKQIEKDSREVIRKAVYRMLPKNKLRDKIIKRLKIIKTKE